MKDSEFYLICSYKKVTNGDFGMMLQKYNLSGQLVSSAISDSASGISKMDSDGNFYFMGGKIMKFNGQGVLLWKNTFDTPINIIEAVSDFGIDYTRNVYVTGILNNNPASNRDYITIKYNSLTGEKEWTKIYNGPFNHKDRAYGIAVDSAGNSYVSGESVGADTSYDCTTIKYNTSGDEVWIRRYSYATGANNDESGYKLFLDGKGKLYIGGSSRTTSNTSYLILKYNTEGDLEYTLRYNGLYSTNYFRDFLLRENSDILVTGQSGGSFYGITTVKYSSSVGISSSWNTLPLNYNLKQNFPNPFNPTTKIKFDIPLNFIVTLKVYDALGKEVQSLVNEQHLNAGSYESEWDASAFPSGVYFYKLSTDKFSEVKKMVLLK